MTIAPATTETTYVLAGSAVGPFSTVWPYAAAADVSVWLDLGLGAGPSILVLNEDYQLTGLAPLSTGGSVLLQAYLVPNGGWPGSASLTLARATPDGQPSAFGEAGSFSPAAAEAAIDNLGRQIQDIASRMARMTISPFGEPAQRLPARAAMAGLLLMSAAVTGDISGVAGVMPGAVFVSTFGAQLAGTTAAGARTLLGVGPVITLEQFNANAGTGGDDTAALQAALDVGGNIQLGPKAYNFSNVIATKPFRLTGNNQAAGATGSSYLICTAGDATDKFVIGNGAATLYGARLEHLVIGAPTATGGAITYWNSCGDSAIEDVQMVNLHLSESGLKTWQMNAFRIDKVRVVETTRAGLLCQGDDTHRTDQINIFNFIVSGDVFGAGTHLPNGIERDGFVNTITGSGWAFVGCGRGLYYHNAIGSTFRAEFVEVHDLEVDFPKFECIRHDWGDGCYYTAAYLHGSQTTHNVVINNVVPNTSTNISFIGGNCTGAFKNAMFLDGRYIRVIGMLMTANSQQGTGLYPAVQLGPNSVAVMLALNHIGAESGLAGAWHSYGVQIDAGAVEYMVALNDLTGNVTGPLIDNTAVEGESNVITWPNIGQYTEQDMSVKAVANAFNVTFGQYPDLKLRPTVGGVATGTVNLAKGTVNGQRARIRADEAIAALTVHPHAGDVIDTESLITAMAAQSSYELRWNRVDATWYRFA